MVAFHQMILALMPVLVDQTPLVREDTVTFYDKYQEHVGYIRTDGYVNITCDLGIPKSSCDYEKAHLIGPDNKTVASANCSDQVSFRLLITIGTPFGEYRCRYGNETSKNAFNFTYRLCADTEEACKGDRTDPCGIPGYCVVTALGTNACVTPGEPPLRQAECSAKESGVRNCPDDEGCEPRARYFQALGNFTCERFAFGPATSPADKKRFMTYNLYNQPNFVLPVGSQDSHIRIHAPTCSVCHYDLVAQCVIRNDNGDIVESQKLIIDRRNPYIQSYTFDKISDKAFAVFEMKCIFQHLVSDDYQPVARLRNFLVSFGERAHIEVEFWPSNTYRQDDYDNVTLRCYHGKKPPAQFLITYQWKDCDGNEIFSNGTELQVGAEMELYPWPHKFCCFYEIIYKPCAQRWIPLRHVGVVEYILKSPPRIKVGSTDTSSTKSSTTSSKPTRIKHSPAGTTTSSQKASTAKPDPITKEPPGANEPNDAATSPRNSGLKMDSNSMIMLAVAFLIMGIKDICIDQSDG